MRVAIILNICYMNDFKFWRRDIFLVARLKLCSPVDDMEIRNPKLCRFSYLPRWIDTTRRVSTRFERRFYR